MSAAVDRAYREEFGRVVARLCRAYGDIELAEDAAQDAFEAALAQWDVIGVPDEPRAWLLRTAKNKAIDRLRQRKWIDPSSDAHDDRPAASEHDFDDERLTSGIEDDTLRLFFTCCHPALAVEAQVALTLRTLGGLTTEEIARAFLVPTVTMAQRLVRAKTKIKGAKIPYEVPRAEVLQERLPAVMAALYLVFNEGYAATSGAALVRVDLVAAAIRLGRMLALALPHEREIRGLLALMLLTDARRGARVDAAGDLVRLEDQDRTKWDSDAIREGLALVLDALRGGPAGRYAIEAAIAAVHAEANVAAATDWPQIAALYGILRGVHPSAVVELNRAVAVAFAEGPTQGLAILDAIADDEALVGYHVLPLARGELLFRSGRREEAAVALRAALALTTNEVEKRALEARLRVFLG